MTNPRAAAISYILLLAAITPAAAQHEMHVTSSIAPDTAIPLFDNLGPHSRQITTASPGAQAYFDQGMRLAYGFGMPEAQRSFEAAIRQDPACAMCHWGLAWALGPYVNGGGDSASLALAHEHVRHAKRLARNATPVERALIDAMLVRYVAAPRESDLARLDTAYMHAMRAVAAQFPDDLDVATHYAESMMLLRPWDYWTRGGEPQPGIDQLLRTLENILARDVRHPGACHLYIHATEASLQPERAEECADQLVDGMPGASHMRHMPSHTYMRIGRYADGVRSNQLAWIADQQAAHGGATAIYPAHNLHMLLFAATYDGQSAIALQAARDLARLSPGSAWHYPLVLARFGRWEELLELRVPADAPMQQAMLAYGQGLAQVRTGQYASARMGLAGIESLRATSTRQTQRNLLGLARAILSAEIDAGEGRLEDAIRTLQTARTIETDSLAYDEPEDWIIPLRHVLGAILLEADRPADAEAAYRGDLEVHPENGWALLGLASALEAQGRAEEAAQVLARFRSAWARSDVYLRGSRF
jgi:tetratricopeptide (TPR) repeat protein